MVSQKRTGRSWLRPRHGDGRMRPDARFRGRRSRPHASTRVVFRVTSTSRARLPRRSRSGAHQRRLPARGSRCADRVLSSRRDLSASIAVEEIGGGDEASRTIDVTGSRSACMRFASRRAHAADDIRRSRAVERRAYSEPRSMERAPGDHRQLSRAGIQQLRPLLRTEAVGRPEVDPPSPRRKGPRSASAISPSTASRERIRSSSVARSSSRSGNP